MDRSAFNELRLLHANVSAICDAMEDRLERSRVLGGVEGNQKAAEIEVQLLSAYRLKLDILRALGTS